MWSKKTYHCDEALVPIFKKYLSQNNGFYVDVGANDGRAASNSFHLEKNQNWSGVLIEPVLHNFFRARQLRSLEKNTFFNCACVGSSFNDETVELIYSGLMTVSIHGDRLTSPEEWARSGNKFLSRGECVQRIWSEARTLESLLLEANAPKNIDLLSIDVEGAEYEVLQGVDFQHRNFSFILIETTLGSKSCDFLSENNFIHIETIAQNLLFASPRVLSVK